MPVLEELGELPERYRRYAEELRDILVTYDVRSLRDLGRLRETAARQALQAWFERVRESDGGKIGFGGMGLVVGTALGGVGIAAAGGAIGVTLALILGIVGGGAGTAMDARGTFASLKGVWLRLPPDLHARVAQEAREHGVSVQDVIIGRLQSQYSEWIEAGRNGA